MEGADVIQIAASEAATETRCQVLGEQLDHAFILARSCFPGLLESFALVISAQVLNLALEELLSAVTELQVLVSARERS
jgi:hypothetical protein